MAGEPLTRYVYDISEVDPENLDLFGGKAAGIARMSQQGLPVPPAFVITTDAYRAYRDAGDKPPCGLARQIDHGLRSLESATGRSFAGDGLPLLVSVRSGAKVSMPGMMDTILNLGLDARSVKALVEVSGDRRFAIDSWICFWTMYGDIVLGLDPTLLAGKFDEAVAGAVRSNSIDDLRALETAIVSTIEAEGAAAPTESRAQLDNTNAH